MGVRGNDFWAATIPPVLSFGVQVLIQVQIQKWKIENLYIIFLICLGVVVFGILIYVSLFYLPQNAEKYLSETYLEYRLVEKE